MICRAAYKGFADCIRLLLFLDAYRGRQDKEGNFFCLVLEFVQFRDLYNFSFEGARYSDK